LIGALADANPFVRRDAATALGRFGLEAKPAAGALNRLLKDKEKSVRRAAADALQRMEAAK
jgi:HEAT repeat protein